VLVSAVSALGYLEGWQVRALDLLQRLQGRGLPHDVVIVAVDEAAFEGLGRRQPISRRYLASVVRGLQKSGAAVIGIDITVTTPTASPADAALAGAIRAFSDGGQSRVVLLAPLGPGAVPLGTTTLGPAVMLASPAVPADPDGFIRRIDPVLAGPSGRPVPTLALAVAARMAGLDTRALEDALAQGRPLALPRLHGAAGLTPTGSPPVTARIGAEWPINYVGPSGSFLTIPSDVVASIGAGDGEAAADNPLRGRIALIGGTFADGRDFYPTPHGLMPGVEVHANVLHMLTTRRFIRPSNWVVGLAVNGLVALAAGVVLVTLRPLTGTLACVSGAFVLGVPAALLAFDRGGYWIDFVLPVVATALVAFGGDALDRRRFRDSFAPARSDRA
jgi:CHASE2 domain-containing sensor protein